METGVTLFLEEKFQRGTSAIARRSFDATISSLDAETSSLGAVTSAIARSYQRYRRGVSGDIGDCGVGITPQICNRVTNHGDMSTFSKPDMMYETALTAHWLRTPKVENKQLSL